MSVPLVDASLGALTTICWVDEEAAAAVVGTGDAMTSSASADSQRLVVTLVTPPAFPAVARFAWPPRIPWVIERTPDAMRCCHTLLRGWAHGKVQP